MANHNTINATTMVNIPIETLQLMMKQAQAAKEQARGVRAEIDFARALAAHGDNRNRSFEAGPIHPICLN